jgi:hypothetical protein
MTKEDDAFDCYCFQAAADATLEAVIRELTDEARLSGGFVAMFGPPEVLEVLEEGADGEPPAPGRRGLTVLPGPWWPPR